MPNNESLKIKYISDKQHTYQFYDSTKDDIISTLDSNISSFDSSHNDQLESLQTQFANKQKGPQGSIGHQGKQGVQGITGNQGSSGLAGVQGLRGLPGLQGSDGVQGEQGTRGNKGINGYQGSMGYQGSTGLLGDIGNQGEVGPQGEQGTRGIRGQTGYQGSMGRMGNQGSQGAYGDDGNQGKQGPQGNQGLKGIIGYQGSEGTQGSRGIQGEIGVDGKQGSRGFRGLQGTFGQDGSQGELGNQGSQGLQGDVGIDGPQGQQGPKGIQGKQGLMGTQGSKGIQGYMGMQSTSIADSGIQGSMGNQGIALSYENKGAQGKPGNAGHQGTIERLISLNPDFSSLINLYSAGSQGSPGKQGKPFKGIQTTSTETGNLGMQGANGAQGKQGNQGYKGSQTTQLTQQTIENRDAMIEYLTEVGKGNQGNKGVQGKMGTMISVTKLVGDVTSTTDITGYNGNQGVKGNTIKGKQGYKGPMGADPYVYTEEAPRGAQGEMIFTSYNTQTSSYDSPDSNSLTSMNFYYHYPYKSDVKDYLHYNLDRILSTWSSETNFADFIKTLSCCIYSKNDELTSNIFRNSNIYQYYLTYKTLLSTCGCVYGTDSILGTNEYFIPTLNSGETQQSGLKRYLNYFGKNPNTDANLDKEWSFSVSYFIHKYALLSPTIQFSWFGISSSNITINNYIKSCIAIRGNAINSFNFNFSIVMTLYLGNSPVLTGKTIDLNTSSSLYVMISKGIVGNKDIKLNVYNRSIFNDSSISSKYMYNNLASTILYSEKNELVSPVFDQQPGASNSYYIYRFDVSSLTRDKFIDVVIDNSDYTARNIYQYL